MCVCVCVCVCDQHSVNVLFLWLCKSCHSCSRQSPPTLYVICNLGAVNLLDKQSFGV